MISDFALVTRRSDGGWHFTWPPGTPPYSIWLDGILQTTVSTPVWDSRLPGYEVRPPEIEILNAGDPVENKLYPPRALLQWRGNQKAIAYVIDSFIGPSSNPWVNIGNVRETGQGYYQWLSQPIPDKTFVQYRVAAVDILGNENTPINFSKTEVCNPKGPLVKFSISSTNAIVVSQGP